MIRKIVLVLAFIVCAFTATGVFLSIESPLNNTSLRQHPAITYVKLNMPESAENATIINQEGYNGWFYYVEFSAPENDIMNFVAGFCDGNLAESYDPFNAEDTPHTYVTLETENYILVETRSRRYYSYSMNTPATYKGNRCWDDDEGYYHILVDESDPNNLSVRVLVGLLSALERYEMLNSSG